MSDNAANKTVWWSGLILIAAPLLSVFAMMHHPTAHGETAAERLSSITHVAALNAWVHGGLIALTVAVFIALTTLASELGWGSARTRAGATAYLVGVLCMVGAALVSGFMVPGLAERYAEASPAEMEAAAPVFRLAHEANQALAQAGAVAMSAGILSWSLLLARRSGWVKGVGIFGVLVGVVPILGLVLGRLHLDVHGMLAVVVAQAAWQVAIGVWLLQGARSAGQV